MGLLAQVTYETSSSSGQLNGGVLAAIWGLSLFWGIVSIVGMWKMFSKAGQPGWTAIIPILNLLVWLKMVKRPLWWIVLFLPCLIIVPFIMAIIIFLDTAKAFGRGIGTVLLLLFLHPIGLLVMGFSKSEYQLEKEPLFG